MARNKIIYALSDVAVVVATTAGTGGTWAGAIEALRGGCVPVLVRVGRGAPPGNEALLAEGARPFSVDALPADGTPAALLAAAGPAVRESPVAESAEPYHQESLSLVD
jgi:predicted Rossmann fold nucleotide-binding protein DprA/Smf involved in DNA uptake